MNRRVFYDTLSCNFQGLKKSGVPERPLMLRPHGSPGENGPRADWNNFSRHYNFTAQHTNLVALVPWGNGLLVAGVQTNTSMFDLLAIGPKEIVHFVKTNKQQTVTWHDVDIHSITEKP